MLYAQKPTEFEAEVHVVGCYMEHDGRFVLLRRLPHKRAGDRWGLPAGKMESSESSTRAMEREIREETGIAIDGERLVQRETWFVEHPDRSFVFETFSLPLDDRPKVVLHPDEHHEFRWVTPHEALDLPLILDQDHCIRTRYGL